MALRKTNEQQVQPFSTRSTSDHLTDQLPYFGFVLGYGFDGFHAGLPHEGFVLGQFTRAKQAAKLTRSIERMRV